MTRLVNVATPPTAATVVVPLSTPVPVPLLRVATTLTVEVEIRLLAESVMLTDGDPATTPPFTTPDG